MTGATFPYFDWAGTKGPATLFPTNQKEWPTPRLVCRGSVNKSIVNSGFDGNQLFRILSTVLDEEQK
eukprot:scaffold45107_cov153-Amphora_coffeaeformis.AAC.2